MSKLRDQHRRTFFAEYVQPLEDQHARLIARLKKGRIHPLDMQGIDSYIQEEEAISMTLLYLVVCKYTPADHPLYTLAETYLGEGLIDMFRRSQSERLADLAEFFLDFLDDPEKHKVIYRVIAKEQFKRKAESICEAEFNIMHEMRREEDRSRAEQRRYAEQVADDEAELIGNPLLPEDCDDPKPLAF